MRTCEVLDKAYQSKDIVLEPVTQFAYGTYADGNVGLWAAGFAGWFVIERPSLKYKRWYDSMQDAVQIMYMLADLHHKKIRGKYVTKERVFEEVSRRSNQPQRAASRSQLETNGLTDST